MNKSMYSSKILSGKWRSENRYSRAWDHIVNATPETRLKEMRTQAARLGTHTDLNEKDILDLMHDARIYFNMDINTSYFHATLRRSVRHGRKTPRSIINPQPWAHMNNIKWWSEKLKGRNGWERLAAMYMAVLRNAIEHGEELPNGQGIKRALSYSSIGILANCTFGTADVRMQELQKLGLVIKSKTTNPTGSNEWIFPIPTKEEQKPAEGKQYPINMGLPYLGKHRELIYHPSLEFNQDFHDEVNSFRAGVVDEDLHAEYHYVRDCPLRGFNEYRELLVWPSPSELIPDAVGASGMLALQTLAAFPGGEATTKELSEATGMRAAKVRDSLTFLHSVLPGLVGKSTVKGSRATLWVLLDDFEIDRVGHELGYSMLGEVRREDSRNRWEDFSRKKYRWVAAIVHRVRYDDVVMVAHEWFKDLRDASFQKTRRVLVDYLVRGSGFKRLRCFQERIRSDFVTA